MDDPGGVLAIGKFLIDTFGVIGGLFVFISVYLFMDNRKMMRDQMAHTPERVKVDTMIQMTLAELVSIIKALK